MGWKVVVVAGSVLVAALGGVGWAVSASATPPSPVIGPPVVVTPVAKASPPFEPTESPDPPAGSESLSPTPSHSTASPTAPAPSVTESDEAPEIVAPHRVQPVEDNGDDEDEYPDDDGVEVDDD